MTDKTLSDEQIETMATNLVALIAQADALADAIYEASHERDAAWVRMRPPVWDGIRQAVKHYRHARKGLGLLGV
jgi:hypothetical protein